MHSLIDFLGFIIVKASSLILCCTPLQTALWIGRRGGDFAYLVNSRRRAIAYANLKSAFPEKTMAEIKGILKSHYENLGMSIVELLKMPVLGKRYLDRHVSMRNAERAEEALRKGKGLIFLTAHFGNWEISSLAVSSMGYRMSVFAREQKYRRLNNLLNKYRETTGCRVITKGFSVRDIIKTLKDNGIIAMLGDQDAGANGVFIDFLGRPASVASGAVIFGLKTGATILPSFIRRVGYDKHVAEIGKPLELISTGDKEKDVKLNLEKATHILEGNIRRSPEQWLWSHKRWKSTPQRTVLVLDDGKPGHLNQGMAVAEMVEEALSSRLNARGIDERPIVKIHTAKVKFKNKLTRALLDLASVFAGRRCQGSLRCMRFCLEKESFDELKNRYRDMIVSCGASTVAANVFLRYENNAKNIVIMKPGLARSSKFDLVILPRHDAPPTLTLSPEGKGKGEGVMSNVLISEAAPNRITNEERRAAGSGIGLLIGGDAKNFRLKREAVEKIVDDSLKIADEMNLDLFVSTSRRTSVEIETFLKNKLQRHERCRLLIIANEKNIDNALPTIFGMSKVVIVSPESVSMISEAASSGRYTVVFGAGSLAAKYARAVENLETRGYIRNATPGDIYNTVKGILTERPAVKMLDDRSRIIERLTGIL